MKNSKLLHLLIPILFLNIFGISSQTIYIRQTNGNENWINFKSIVKLTFSNGNCSVLTFDKYTSTYPLFSMKNFSFSIKTDNPQYFQAEPNLKLTAFPNPVSTVLNIDLSNEDTDGVIKLFTIEGKRILTQNSSNRSMVQIYIGHLPKGIYLCKYENNSESKILKILKQ